MAHKWDSKLYDDKHQFVYQYGSSLIELLEPQPHEIILDLGCGTGHLTNEIKALCNQIIGMDASTEMIEAARKSFPALDFRVADATTFTFPERFDAIFSNATLHWIKEAPLAARKLHEHLKPGGRLVIEFGGKGNCGAIRKALKKTLADRGYHKQAASDLWYFPTIGEYASLLENVGFEVSWAQHFDRPTLLADEKSGLLDWISMFATGYFKGIPLEDQNMIKKELESILKLELFKKGQWYADYRRLRVKAIKPL